MEQKSIASWCGFCAAMLLMVGLCAASTATTTRAATSHVPAVRIVLSGPIDDMQYDALVRRFDAARKLGARVIILQIDTYGGAVTAGLTFSQEPAQPAHHRLRPPQSHLGRRDDRPGVQ
jgi:membrane-bound ClpP family serine protease